MTKPNTAASTFMMGDRDAARGLPIRASETISTVSNLQDTMRSVGLIDESGLIAEKPEKFQRGYFDSTTGLAVRRFQWYLTNRQGAISRTGAFVRQMQIPTLINGVANPSLLQTLQSFYQSGQKVTGRLTAIHLVGRPNIKPHHGFVALLGTDRNIGICDVDFKDVIDSMVSRAAVLQITIFVNHLFRVQGRRPSGAVVEPAKYSAHKIGRAIDLQLGFGPYNDPRHPPGPGYPPVPENEPRLSIEIKSARPGSPFYSFREGLKSELHLRYGGDFAPPGVDPPHFDRQILPATATGMEWHYHFFFNQLQYRQSLINQWAIPWL